jgi:mono/diheme cytochrome c family protein
MKKPLITITAAAGCSFFLLTAQQSAPPAIFTAAQAAAGKAAYESSCNRCHTDALVGRDGTGEIPEIAQPYKGRIPPLAGANSAFPPFMTKWGPRTTNALYKRISEAVPAFPPPGLTVNEELGLDITAYVLQVNGARPGTQPLTTATEVEIRSIAPGIAP